MLALKRRCVVLLVVTVGCAAPVDPAADGSSSSGDPTPPATTEGPNPDPTIDPSVDSTIDPSTTSESSGVPETSTSVDDTSTTDDTTTGGILECSTFEQDCPDGFKCMPYDDTGGGTWNTTGCFPIADDPVGLGETCEGIGGGATGEDTCAAGLMCWGAPGGECLALCEGNPAMPQCGEATSCSISNGGAVAVCLPSCDPLLEDCGEGQACYAVGPAEFGCAPEGGAAQGESCTFINDCGSGLLCAGGEVVAGCESQGCCTAYCDLSDPTDDCSGTGEGMACVAMFAKGMAPEGLESVGICAAL